MTRFAARMPRRKLLRSSPLSRRLVRSIQSASSPSRRRPSAEASLATRPSVMSEFASEDLALALVLPHEADDLRPGAEQGRLRHRGNRRPAQHGPHVLPPAQELGLGLEAVGQERHPAGAPLALEGGEVGTDARQIRLVVGNGALADRRTHVGLGRGRIAEARQERLDVLHGAGCRRHRRGGRHQGLLHRLSLASEGSVGGSHPDPRSESSGPFVLSGARSHRRGAQRLGIAANHPVLPETARFTAESASRPRHTFPVCRRAVG
jgi:hypothetical protein